MAIQNYQQKIGPYSADKRLNVQIGSGQAASAIPQGAQAPPTGLIGSEQALMQGYGNALGGLDYGMGMARNDILSQLGMGVGALKKGLSSGNMAFNSGIGALNRAGNQIGGLFDRGIGAGNQYFDQGAESLNPYLDPGYSANQRQAALSGALGADAQRSAMQGFMESPQQAFLREQGERSVTRNAAALGGLGGGNVMKELARFGTGLAAQDFDNQFNRLGQVAGRGAQAASQMASMRGQQGQMNANMLGQQAGIQGNLANAAANLRGQQGAFRGNMANALAGLYQSAGSQLGNQGMQGGMMAGQWGMNTGQNIAQGRTNAGNAIAKSLAGLTSNLSNLANQQGVGLSGMVNQGGSNLANILAQSGLTNAQQQQALAQALSGVGMQGAGYAAGLPGIPGVQQTNGILGDLGNFASGFAKVAPFIGLSDKRLKTNIRKIGETAGGTNLYEWDWTATGRRIAGDQPTIGVIAQEVPDAAVMGADGFLRVDYARVR